MSIWQEIPTCYTSLSELQFPHSIELDNVIGLQYHTISYVSIDTAHVFNDDDDDGPSISSISSLPHSITSLSSLGPLYSNV